ncbi:MAG: hypothetical protein KDA44_13505 [Planctomycetales bacterium]|nr:hypothetical protein [Planctomycetales bacterium]
MAKRLAFLPEVPREIEEARDWYARRLYRNRRLTKFPILVVYREYDDRTLIVTIYDTSRRPDHWKKRLR